MLGNELAQAFYLPDGILDELLSAKAGIDAHQKHHIHIADNILKQ